MRLFLHPSSDRLPKGRGTTGRPSPWSVSELEESVTNIARLEAPASNLLPGTLEYRSADHAFAFEPDIDAAEWKELLAGERSSLAIDTLQIEVSVPTGRMLYVWGYHPVERWSKATLNPPASGPGALKVQSSDAMIPGASLAIDNGSPWITSHDSRSGWICVRSPSREQVSDAVEFASDSIAEVAGARLVALWLHPRIR